MRIQTRSVRTCAGLAAGVMAVVVSAACGDIGTPARPSPVAVGSSAALDDSVDSDLASVRAATAAYHDPAVAARAGYLFGEECIQNPTGAMGVHTPNPPLIASQEVDPDRPELLLYLPRPNGGLRLIGVEYMRVVLVRNTLTGEVGPWSSQAPWPAHYEVVSPTPQLFGQTFNGPMPGHGPSMPWHWDLHAWIWAPNPSGMFAQWNPALSCSN